MILRKKLKKTRAKVRFLFLLLCFDDKKGIIKLSKDFLLSFDRIL